MPPSEAPRPEAPRCTCLEAARASGGAALVVPRAPPRQCQREPARQVSVSVSLHWHVPRTPEAEASRGVSVAIAMTPPPRVTTSGAAPGSASTSGERARGAQARRRERTSMLPVQSTPHPEKRAGRREARCTRDGRG
eukprot:3281592-Rhodomonas_salina.1